MFTFIELCSGLGGMRISMEKLGHKCLGYCECEKENLEMYAMIHETEGLWFSDDINTIKAEELPEVDCYCISCPHAGVKNNFVSLIEIRKPKFVIIEGDCSGARRQLEDIGYYVEVERTEKGWKWDYTIAQRDKRINILPIGLNDLIVGDTWEEKGMPIEMLDKIKDHDCIKSSNNALIRFTQLKAFMEIAKKLET